jgi:uncharacterized protein YndB with AHSA1/START domain
MVRTILLLLGAAVAVLCAVIALQPSTFVIERATEIAAPPEVVFSHLDSPRALDEWSPFVKMDPEQTLTYEGPERGVGAIENWKGPQIGAGRLTITGIRPNEEVELRLEFLEPMKATNRALYTLTPADDGTRIAWRMEGTNNFVGKAASLVMNMDETVGGQFERGLADLKALAEADAKARAEQPVTAQAAREAAPPMTFEEMKAAIGEPPGDPNAMPADPDAPATPPAEE